MRHFVLVISCVTSHRGQNVREGNDLYFKHQILQQQVASEEVLLPNSNLYLVLPLQHSDNMG